MSNYFQILSLDGASKTGGSGWLSIGMLRDLYYRNLRLSPAGEEAIAAMRGRADSASTDPHGCMGELSEFEATVLRLWDRFHGRSQNRLRILATHYEGQPSPLPDELGVMAYGEETGKMDASVFERDFLGIRRVLKREPVSWRHSAATKWCHDRFGPISSDLALGPQALGQFMLDHPDEFLCCWWTYGQDHVPGIASMILRTRESLHALVAKGYLENSDFENLSKVELFAGTSSGGLNALVFAKHEKMHLAIEEAFSLWQDIGKVIGNKRGPGFARKISSYKGHAALYPAATKAVFDRYFEDLTLADLKQNVVLTTVQLDSGEMDYVPLLRRWKTVVYHNFKRKFRSEVDVDANFNGIKCIPDPQFSGAKIETTRVADLAQYTSSIPILAPVPRGYNPFTDHHYSKRDTLESGFIDGGFYANNPSFAAMAAATQFGVKMDDMVVLSLGNARQAIDHVDLRESDLGYRQWLLHSERQGLLFDLMLDLGIDAVNGYCRAVLGTRYERYNAWCDRGFLELNPETDQAVEFALDQALGLYRYVYRESKEGWLKNYWYDQVPTSAD